MSENQGREFEQAVKHSCDRQGIFCFKLRDTYIPLQNINGAFAPKMISDFIMHRDGILYFVECKTTKHKYITFCREQTDKGMIAHHQWTQMYNVYNQQRPDVRCGLLLQYENESNNPKTYYLPIENFVSFMNESDKKSLNPMDCVQHGAIIVPNKMLIKHRAYDIKNTLGEVA